MLLYNITIYRYYYLSMGTVYNASTVPHSGPVLAYAATLVPVRVLL